MTAWVLLAAAAQVAASPASAKLSPQAAFDAASADYIAGRHAEAIAAFTELQGRVRSRKILGVIRLRKGLSLIEMHRREEGEADLRAAFAMLSPTDETMQPELFEARMEAWAGALARLDYDVARADSEAGLLVAGGDVNRVRAELLLARATMFDADDTAVRHADIALGLAATMRDIDKAALGDIYTIHARALLNHGRTAEALAELRKAVTALGGLTMKVDMRDIITRSDLAIAALLSGRKDIAREYLAYTGAGRGKQPFATAAALDLPSCGGETGLDPQDVAVVEFSIADDGSVISASPIYSTRLGPAALEFARAARNWSWRPEDVKDIPPIFRYLTRVEMRCTTSSERPSILRPIAVNFGRWLDDHGVKDFELPTAVGPALVTARAELDRRRPAGGIALVAPLVSIGSNETAAQEDRSAALAEAGNLLEAANAPASVAIYPRLLDIMSLGNSWSVTHTNERRAALRGLLARPEVASDAQLATTIRLLIAEPAYRSVNTVEAEPLLRQIVDDKRLAEGDPLRTGALLRLATLQAGSGRINEARASYAASGLTAQQCSLVDARQAISSKGASSSDFPMEAMRWGFEGWVRA